jgi:hypothetical protein
VRLEEHVVHHLRHQLVLLLRDGGWGRSDKTSNTSVALCEQNLHASTNVSTSKITLASTKQCVNQGNC